MGANVNDAIDQALDYLDLFNRPVPNRLTTTVTSGTASIVLDFDLTGIAVGTLVEIENELMMVLDLDATSSTLTVSRGYRSTAAGHNAGVLVSVRPRFPRAFLMRQMRSEILSWPDDLFSTAEVTVSAANGTEGYTFDTTDVTRILDVWLGPESTDSSNRWMQLDGGFDFKIQRDQSAPTTSRIILPDYGVARTLTVTVAKRFSAVVPAIAAWNGSVDLEATVLLSTSMIDLAALGAAVRVLQEAPRSQQVINDKHLTEASPPGHMMQVRQDLQRQRDRRLHEEVQRLLRLYPYRG